MTSAKEQDLLFVTFLARLPFLTASEKVRLLNFAPSAEYLSKLTINDLGEVVKRKLRGKFDGIANLRDAEREVAIFESKKISFITCKDEGYPSSLIGLKDSPFALFYKGDGGILSASRLVSVVGTRLITPDANNKTRKFSYDAAKDGCVVVSGLASGADGAAHNGALDAYYDALEDGFEARVKTIAVLPCSVNTVTPRIHAKLAGDILSAGGCIVSENTPLSELKKWSFVSRNRIIAALSEATIVSQAPVGSGALITASYATEYKKTLFFLEAAFSEQAQKVDDAVRARLEKDYSAGLVPRSKLENTCQKYINAGSVVIKDYEDYKKQMARIRASKASTPQRLDDEEIIFSF